MFHKCFIVSTEFHYSVLNISLFFHLKAIFCRRLVSVADLSLLNIENNNTDRSLDEDTAFKGTSGTTFLRHYRALRR
jgi:hypothetical protein